MTKDPQQYVQTVFDEASCFLGLLDTDGILLTTNKASLVAVGVSADDVIGMPFVDGPWCQNEAQRKQLAEAIRKACCGETAQLTMQHNWMDVPTRTMALVIRPVFDDNGKVIYLLPEASDVTELKVAELESNESYEFDQLLVNISSRFINIPSNQIIDETVRAQKLVAQMFDFDHTALLYLNTDSLSLEVGTQWNCEECAEHEITAKDFENFEWFPKVIAEGKVRLLTRDDIPPSGHAEREFVERHGDVCYLMIPLQAEGAVIGALGFSSFSRIVEFTPEQLERLTLFGNIIANAIARKRSDERIANSEKRFRLIAEHARDVLTIYRLSPPSYEYVSPSSTRLLGFSPEELYADPGITAECVHPDDRDKFERFLENPAQFKTAVALRFYHKNGELIWLEFLGTTRVNKDGNITHVESIARDVTERVTATAKIREQDERLRGIAENLTIGICILDRDLEIIEINPKMCDWFPDIKENLATYKHMPCDMQDQCEECVSRKTAKDGKVRDVVRPLQTAIGERIFRILACPIRDESNTITHVVETLEDITERQHLQQQMLQAQKLQAIGTLSGGIAHEINQPLSAIKLTAGILQRVLGNLTFDSKDDIVRRIDRIGSCADEIDRIVQHIRALLRTDDGADPQNHNINDLAKDALYLLRAQLEAHSIRLEMNLIEEDIKIHVSGGQFQQVVGGLITNAREALDVTSGTDKQILMTTTTVGNNAMLTIEDNGLGMGENIGRAFDPFFTTKDPGMGLGLGLSLSHTLVTSWGGALTADASPLGGAKLTITLPIAPNDTESD